jgi:signal transduction histidine kinase
VIAPWRQGLTGRIVLFVTTIVASCGVMSVLIIATVISSQLEESYASDRQTSIDFLTVSLVPMVELGDYQRVERTIEAVLVYENIVSLAVYDADGTLIRSVTELGEASLPTDTISHVLGQGDALVGRVDIGFSRTYIDAQVGQLTRVLAVAITALLAATASALLWYFSRLVVQPLRVFTQTVRSMTSDNLGLRVPVSGTDEIGVLASSFNAMAEDLQQSSRQLREAHAQLEERYMERAEREERRTEQVRRIFEMRQRLIEISDLPDMLQYVASALQSAFAYYRVNVFLADDAVGDLELSASAGGSRDVDSPLQRVQAGNGIVGSVLQSCRPLLATDVSREPSYGQAPELKNTRAELAVPIAIGTLTLGVLDIQADRMNGLDEMDLFTAQTVADQIANVVENARVAEETRSLAILDERNRMAREIHDTLAQGFTGIVLQLEAAEQSLGDSPAAAAAHIDRARKLARDSLAEARRSVWALRPTILENRRLADALRREVRTLQDEGRIQATCHISGVTHELAADVEEALLRICQESLTNIRRHSDATRAQVRLTVDSGRVRLSVQDDGVGFDPATRREGSFGLIGIHERARQCGGILSVTSQPGQGTLVEVEIPVERRLEDE